MSRLCWRDAPPSTRPVRAADRPWLQAALEVDVLCCRGAVEPTRATTRLAEDSPERHAAVLEFGGRLAGFACLRRGSTAHAPPLQPWDRREGDSLVSPDSTGDALEIEMLAWRRGDEADRRREILFRDACQRACQQLDAERLLLAASPRSFETWARAMGPEAFLQQLHHRAIDDEALTPLLEMGCRLDGYRPTSEASTSFEAILVWSH